MDTNLKTKNNDQDQPPQYEYQGVQPPIQQQPQVVSAIYVAQVPVVPIGPNPSHRKCPSCHQEILTRMEYESSMKTHGAAMILCCCLCWPCAWIPYVMDSCKNGNHYCPACNAYIGTYKN